MERLEITVYRRAGRKWGLRMDEPCVECEMAATLARVVAAAHPDWPVAVVVKPWLTNLWEAVSHGGWHTPVVLVDGRRVSQGRVPGHDELEAALHQAVARRGLPASENGEHETFPAGPRFF